MLNLHLEDHEWPYEFTDHDREVVRAIVVDDGGAYYFCRAVRDDDFGRSTLIETSGGGVEPGEDLLTAIRAFRTFAGQSRHRWLHGGAFMRVYERATEVSESARQLAKEFSAAAPASARERVLGKAISLFLMEGEAPESEVENLVREFKDPRLPLIKMSRDYNSAPVEEKIRIRDEILRQGLPGDPIVRRMWGFRKYPR